MPNLLQASITQIAARISSILQPLYPTIYLYGSITLNDFKPGWSDVDILVLTDESISQTQATQLVTLRETMLSESTDNPYFRSFEGGMLTLNAFISGQPDRVVYWGTSGERITDKYDFDAFCMSELIDSGILLYGSDIRDRLSRPTFAELKSNVQRHYEVIRRHIQKTDRSLYSYGWLLDISRCIYTLRTGRIIAKTAAGEWALREGLCPCRDDLAKAVMIRREPVRYLNDESIFDYAETLGDNVQSYADVLESELKRCC